jgi:hypothetical protein
MKVLVLMYYVSIEIMNSGDKVSHKFNRFNQIIL